MLVIMMASEACNLNRKHENCLIRLLLHVVVVVCCFSFHFIFFFLEQRLVALAPNIDFLFSAMTDGCFLTHSFLHRLLPLPRSKRNSTPSPLRVSGFLLFLIVQWKGRKKIQRTFRPGNYQMKNNVRSLILASRLC